MHQPPPLLGRLASVPCRAHRPSCAKAMTGMAPEHARMSAIPTPTEREALAGLVERVTDPNPDNGFGVLGVKLRGARELVTLVGAAAAISAGEFVQASGRISRRPSPASSRSSSARKVTVSGPTRAKVAPRRLRPLEQRQQGPDRIVDVQGLKARPAAADDRQHRRGRGRRPDRAAARDREDEPPLGSALRRSSR